jgi:hypothetical protein
MLSIESGHHNSFSQLPTGSNVTVSLAQRHIVVESATVSLNQLNNVTVPMAINQDIN